LLSSFDFGGKKFPEPVFVTEQFLEEKGSATDLFLRKCFTEFLLLHFVAFKKFRPFQIVQLKKPALCIPISFFCICFMYDEHKSCLI